MLVTTRNVRLYRQIKRPGRRGFTDMLRGDSEGRELSGVEGDPVVINVMLDQAVAAVKGLGSVMCFLTRREDPFGLLVGLPADRDRWHALDYAWEIEDKRDP